MYLPNYEHYFEMFQLTVSKHTQISPLRTILLVGNCMLLHITRKLQFTGCKQITAHTGALVGETEIVMYLLWSCLALVIDHHDMLISVQHSLSARCSRLEFCAL